MDSLPPVGSVVQPTENNPGAWSQAIITRYSTDTLGNTYANLARPYAYVTCAGTTSPSTVTGTENYQVEATRFLRTYTLTDPRTYIMGTL